MIRQGKKNQFYGWFLHVSPPKYPKTTPIEPTFDEKFRFFWGVSNFSELIGETCANWGKKCQKLSKADVFLGVKQGAFSLIFRVRKSLENPKNEIRCLKYPSESLMNFNFFRFGLASFG